MSYTKGDTAGYVNLDYVVKTVMMDLDEYHMHNYEKFLRLAARGFTDINIYAINNIKVAYLPINDNFTADIPDDLIMYTKIGINIGGRVWTLTYNDNIVLPRKVDKCGKTLSEISECSSDDDGGLSGGGLGLGWGFYFADHYRNGQYVGEMFGIGGGFNISYYNIDWERRQIVLGSELSSKNQELIIEYKSSGIGADGSTVVPKQSVEALVAYVHWKRISRDLRIPLSNRRDAQDQYQDEYEKLKFFEDSFTVDEYLDHTYKHSQSTPRR